MIPLFAWFAERLFINVALRSALNFPELFWFGCQVQDLSRTIGDRTAVLNIGGMTGERWFLTTRKSTLLWFYSKPPVRLRLVDFRCVKNHR